MQINDVDFSSFAGRQQDLQKVGRYHMYQPMFYRPDVYFHSRKVFHLVNAALPSVIKTFPQLNSDRALVMALVHDDIEMIIGDYQSGNRAKLDEQQLRELKKVESVAALKLKERFPETIHGFNYYDLLCEVDQMKTVESQVVKYIDRLDAFCEALHELYAGNTRFATQITNELGTIELPTEYYITRFNNYPETYSILVALIEKNQLPFIPKYELATSISIAKTGAPHTAQSIQLPKDQITYDWWMEILRASLSAEELSLLYIKKE